MCSHTPVKLVLSRQELYATGDRPIKISSSGRPGESINRHPYIKSLRSAVCWGQAEDVGGSRVLIVEDGKVEDRMVLDALKEAGGILAQVDPPSPLLGC